VNRTGRAPALCLALAAGCAPELVEIGGFERGALALHSCGATGASAAAVIRAMDEPGSVEGGLLPAQRELTVCLRAENRGGHPLKIDRSHSHLRTKTAREDFVPDGKPELLALGPGQASRFSLTFHLSPLQPGDEVTVTLDDLPDASLHLRKR
jgi:hypothetical protein